MRKSSPPVRIINKDYLEIKEIANREGIPFPAAYCKWKNKKIGISWERF